LALHAPDAGTVVIVAPPPGTPGRVLAEVLDALGKSGDERAQAAPVRDLRACADLWLTAHGIDQLVVLQAATLEPEAAEELGEMEARLGLSVSLLVDDSEQDRVRAMAPRHTGPGVAMALERPAQRPASAETPEAPLILPVTAERLAGARARVPFAAAFAAAAAIDDDQRATLPLAASGVRSALAGYGDRDCFAAAARGAAMALREYAWELRPATAAEASRYARAADPSGRDREVAALRRSSSPLLCAVGALAILGLSEGEMLGLLAIDVAADGATVRAGRDVLAVPVDLRPLVRAQLLALGAGTGSPSLPYLGTEPLDRRRLRSEIAVALADVPTPVAPLVRDRGGQDERWLLDRGLALERRPRGRPPVRTGSYDPVRFMEDLRSELAGDWHSITTTRVTCGCGRPHDPPRWDDLPDWPPPPPAHRTPDDHPWKQAGALGRRSPWVARLPAA